MGERPSWEEYFKMLTVMASTRSPCQRLHVGCLIVRDNRIIAQGYNGYLPGCPHDQYIRDGHELATVHAEQNAIADCARRGVSCNESTVYITHYPCINCMKILCASGIIEVKYIEDYRNDEAVGYFSNISGVPVKKI
jgi:dCMP deaminase